MLICVHCEDNYIPLPPPHTKLPKKIPAEELVGSSVETLVLDVSELLLVDTPVPPGLPLPHTICGNHTGPVLWAPLDDT